MKRFVTTCVFALLGVFVFAQNNSQINGRVIEEESGEPAIGASVYVWVGDKLVGDATDVNGDFKIKPLAAGTYNLTISMMGMDTLTLTGIILHTNEVLQMGEVILKAASNALKPVEVKAPYKNPLIRGDCTIEVLETQMIAKSPMQRDPVGLATLVPGVQAGSDGQVIIRGSREGASTYYIDGVRVNSLSGMVPGQAIKSMNVYTGGIPAMYGDVTGGVIVIETKSYFDLYNQRMAGR